MPPIKIILASTSAIRQQLLKNAGITFTCQNPMADENDYKSKNPSLSSQNLALGLAGFKAKSIKVPDAIIIGADQTLSCKGQLFSKAQTLTEAKACLLALRGQTHMLHSAISIFRDGEFFASVVDSAKLTMRNFSEEFLDEYLKASGTDLLYSVGCYQLEKQGPQLFEKIEGDYFTILGFPLLQCLAILRQMKVLKS